MLPGRIEASFKLRVRIEGEQRNLVEGHARTHAGMGRARGRPRVEGREGRKEDGSGLNEYNQWAGRAIHLGPQGDQAIMSRALRLLQLGHHLTLTR